MWSFFYCVLTSLSPLPYLASAPSAVLDNLSVTPECPFSLMVMWKVPNHHDLHASPEEVCYVVKFWRSDEPETVMNRTVNATAMVNGTEVSSSFVMNVCTLRERE